MRHVTWRGWVPSWRGWVPSWRGWGTINMPGMARWMQTSTTRWLRSCVSSLNNWRSMIIHWYAFQSIYFVALEFEGRFFVFLIVVKSREKGFWAKTLCVPSSKEETNKGIRLTQFDKRKKLLFSSFAAFVPVWQNLANFRHFGSFLKSLAILSIVTFA